MKYDGVTKGPNSERLQKLVSEIEKQVNEDKELQKKVDNFNLNKENSTASKRSVGGGMNPLQDNIFLTKSKPFPLKNDIL